MTILTLATLERAFEWLLEMEVQRPNWHISKLGVGVDGGYTYGFPG